MLEALLVKYNSIMIMKTNYWYDAVLFVSKCINFNRE